MNLVSKGLHIGDLVSKSLLEESSAKFNNCTHIVCAYNVMSKWVFVLHVGETGESGNDL